MAKEYVLQVKCDNLAPQCGLQCDPCMLQIQEALVQTSGVTNLHIENPGVDPRLIIGCDNSISSDDLARVLTMLPTMHDDSFVTIVVESRDI